jgi:hypothetical protein
MKTSGNFWRRREIDSADPRKWAAPQNYWTSLIGA